jgi:hypothetical protein
MNKRSAREYTMFAPTQRLRNGVTSGLATRVTFTGVSWGGWKSPLYGGGPASDFIFVPLYGTVFELRFKWCTLYKPIAAINETNTETYRKEQI